MIKAPYNIFIIKLTNNLNESFFVIFHAARNLLCRRSENRRKRRIENRGVYRKQYDRILLKLS